MNSRKPIADFKLVSREPTPEMHSALVRAFNHSLPVDEAWRDAFDASPGQAIEDPLCKAYRNAVACICGHDGKLTSKDCPVHGEPSEDDAIEKRLIALAQNVVAKVTTGGDDGLRVSAYNIVFAALSEAAEAERERCMNDPIGSSLPRKPER